MKYWFGLILFFFSTFTMAQDPIYTGTFSNKALDGYDTVAYFTEANPLKEPRSLKLSTKVPSGCLPLNKTWTRF